MITLDSFFLKDVWGNNKNTKGIIVKNCLKDYEVDINCSNFKRFPYEWDTWDEGEALFEVLKKANSHHKGRVTIPLKDFDNRSVELLEETMRGGSFLYVDESCGDVSVVCPHKDSYYTLCLKNRHKHMVCGHMYRISSLIDTAVVIQRILY